MDQTYDADGNLTFDGANTYTYDQQSRLTSISGPAGLTEYEYDAFGNRVATVTNGQRVEYLLDLHGLGYVTAEYDGIGQIAARNTYGLGLAQRLAGGSASFYEFDAAGSTAGITGDGGFLTERFSYGPFGELLVGNTFSNPFTYIGQFGVTSTVNGGFYMRARQYLPATGQFSSDDPIGLGGGDYNVRRYVENDPINQIDPAGTNPLAAITLAVYVVLSSGIAPIPPQAQDLSHSVQEVIKAISKRRGVFEEARAKVAQATRMNAYQAQRTVISASESLPASRAAAMRGLGVFGLAASILAFDYWLYTHPVELRKLSDKLLDLVDGPTGKNSSQVDTGVSTSIDPNDKFGAEGFGPQAFIKADTAIPYRIRFENLGPGSKDHDGNPYPTFATAPAQRVTITDQLTADLDWNTFQITELGWGDIVASIPPGSNYYAGTQTMTYNGKTFEVELEAGIDLATGRVSVTFQSIDPSWGLPPDILTGFLPPEDGTGRGMGYVLFTVRPKLGLPSGTEIRNVALISFDDQTIIATNQIDPQDASQGTDPAREALNTIDAAPPTSAVAALPANIGETNFLVSWSGSDGAGSGVAAYDVYVKVNGGAWTLWQDHTAASSAPYTGTLGSTYEFYSVAIDNVGYAEAPPATADAATTLVENGWHNFTLAEDVDGVNGVNIQDALAVIRDLRRSGSRDVLGASPTGLRLDVTDDHRVDIQDALAVIRYLRRNRPSGEGEAELNLSVGATDSPDEKNASASAVDLVLLNWWSNTSRKTRYVVD
jgi:RHS repeat-associated protein